MKRQERLPETEIKKRMMLQFCVEGWTCPTCGSFISKKKKECRECGTYEKDGKWHDKWGNEIK